jgi:hypothetical protein
MLRTRSARTPDGWRPGTNSRLGDHRLTGTDGTAIDRLTGDRRAGRLGNTRTRRCGLRRHDRTGRTQFGHQIGSGRHHRTGRRLAGEISRRGRGTGTGPGMRTGLRRRWRRRARASFGPLRPLDHGGARDRPRHGRARSGDAAFTGRCRTLRERLARAGKNLAGPRRGGRRPWQWLGNRRSRSTGRDDGHRGRLRRRCGLRRCSLRSCWRLR